MRGFVCNEPRFLRVRDAAIVLGVTAPKVRAWIRDERIRAVWPGGGLGQLRVPVAEIERLAKSGSRRDRSGQAASGSPLPPLRTPACRRLPWRGRRHAAAHASTTKENRDAKPAAELPRAVSLGGFRLSRDLKTQREQRVRVIARLHGERDAAPAEAERSRRHTSTRRPRRPSTSDGYARMLVATRSFTTTYEGEPVQMTAGRDHVIAAHPIVRANPDAFKAG